MNRFYIFLSLLLLPLTQLMAQQEGQNTLFMYYRQGYNPGVAGTREVPCITAIYRNQWLGIEGAPTLQVLSFSIPALNQRVGIGGNLVRQTVGITQRITLDAIYAYRLRLGRGYLSMGLQGSIRRFSNDYTDPRLVATQGLDIDPSIPNLNQNKFLFNFGAGLFYQGEFFYLGLSAPRLLQNNIDFADSDIIVSREIQHFYFMGGGSIPLGENFDLQPQVLLKYVDNAPFDGDFNLSLRMLEKYIAGVTYRMGGSSAEGFGESIDVLLAAQLSSNFLLGVSYDITLSDLRDYNTGSFEVLLRYCFGKSEGEEYVNPRFF